MSIIIANIMTSGEVAGSEDWKRAEKAINRYIEFNNGLMNEILTLVFNNLHDSPFWTITPEFIIKLGETYLKLLAYIAIEQ